MAATAGLNPAVALVAFAFGRAIGPVLVPGVKDLENFAWSTHRVAPLSAELAAAMVVEGVWTPDRGDTEASYTGIGSQRFKDLVQLIDDPPDLALVFQLWRRGLIDGDRFIEALKHHRIETPYFEALRGLRQILLTPGELAQARQRGFIDQARQYEEAALQGVDNERAEVMFKSAGLPPPTERAREMWRRGIITEAEFKQTIVEGNEKLKYQDEEAALFHPLLTPAQIVNQRLRGWRDTAWMNARGAEHGYSVEQMQDLFEGQGRPITYRQVFIGERRGGVYNGSTAGIEPAFLKSLQESNIRPEWYNLAWAIRHSLPSAFVLRGLTQSGDVSQAEAEELLLWSGWPEALAATVSARWAGGTGAKADPLVKTYTNRAIAEVNSAYVLRQADDVQARGWLDALGVTPETQDALLPIWDVMREIPQRGLTPAQVVKAFKKLPALWPRQRALDELALLGYTLEDAATLLDE